MYSCLESRMSVRRREFLKTTLMTGAAAQVPLSAWARVAGANDAIRTGVVGINGKGWGHVEDLQSVEDVRVVALCDPDRRLLARRRAELEKKKEKVETFVDIREMLDKAALDVVVVATPDHWHALAAVWAMQAGTDVYVEKPLTYCIWEGRQLVAAARRYGRIAQTGSQHRSCPATHKIREYVQSGKLGAVQFAYAQVFNRRKSIGKANGPLEIPPEVDYEIYAGPAPAEPPVRERLHYDWHWQWPMGTGESGNWGAHIIDDALNITGLTEAPRAAIAVGGRFGYDDDGETPNTLLVAFETGRFPLVAQFRALPMRPGVDAMDHFRGIRIGTVIECENGYYAGGRGGGWIYDKDGRRVEPVEGDGGRDHMKNFLGAVRSRRPEDLNAPMQAGHISAVHCHLGNMSYRLGKTVPTEVARKALQSSPLASERFESMVAHLQAHNVDTSAPTLVLGDTIRMDPKTDTCIGPNAAAAGALARRTYREPFVVEG
jgi:predicted dehydrogenase